LHSSRLGEAGKAAGRTASGSTRTYGREGTPPSHWILLDFGGVIVHVFTPPERDYYQLERHWAEAKTVLRVQ
jgi:ribosomal silencing factor RsfS